MQASLCNPSGLWFYLYHITLLMASPEPPFKLVFKKEKAASEMTLEGKVGAIKPDDLVYP